MSDSIINNYIATHAFDDEKDKMTRGIRHYIKRQYTRFKTTQGDLQKFTSPVSLWYLRQALKKNQYQLPRQRKSDLDKFTHFPSSPNHLQIHDKYGNILAYRLRIPSDLLDTLTDSDRLLPPTKLHKAQKEDPRGKFPIRHYALWADYSKKIYYNKHFIHDKPFSEQWLQQNTPLFEYLGSQLRFIFPEGYKKLTNFHYPNTLKPLCPPWAAAAINQHMIPCSPLLHHQDWRDIKTAPNAVIPYGNYTGGDLVLWQCQCVLELLPGDALFFMGSLITHGNKDIQSGIRNSINLFTHKSNVDWQKRERKRKKIIYGPKGN